MSAAAFTGSTAIPSNTVTVDQLSNYFSVTPLNTTVASGGVDNLALDFGTVASARTFTSVFRVTNVSGDSRTAVLTLSNVPQIASLAFAGSGTSITLPAGGSTTVNVTTSATVAGRGSGTLRLGLSGVGWMYRDYSVKLDEAPEAPTAPAVAQKPAGRLDLSWTASTTVTNLGGYNVYRSTGGAYTKLNASPLTGTSYSDTSTVDGTAYTYKIDAVTSGTPLLTSLDSTTVNATADATAPGAPSSVALANGGGTGNAYVNAANASSLSVSVTLPAGSLTTDTVTLTISRGGSSVVATHAGTNGAGTFTVSGLTVAGLGDGALTISASSTDVAGNVGASTSVSVTKDTVAPGAPTANYTDNTNNTADLVLGSAEANASISVSKTSSPTGSYPTTANGSGSYSVNVYPTNGKVSTPVSVTYVVTATDAAGNTSSATTLTLNDTK